MATSDGFICGVCEYQNISKPADHWCPECDEGLCSSCEIHHRSSRGTRKHNVVLIDNYKKLPSTVAKITNYCDEHESKYQLFCPIHDKLCCPVCVSTTHKECVGLSAIEEIVKTSNMSSLLDNLETSLKCMKSNLNEIIRNRSDNITLLHEQRKKYQNEIKEIWNRVISHFNALEKQIQDELRLTEENATAKIQTTLTVLKEKSKIVKDLENDIAAVKEHASSLQAFIGSKQIEDKIVKEEQYMNSLYGDICIQQIQLKCTIDDKITGLVSSISRFGSLTTETSPPSLNLTTGKENQAQIISLVHPVPPKSIEDIKVTLELKFDVLSNLVDIRGCCLLPSGEIILTDYGSGIVIFKENGSLSKEIFLPNILPYDITIIDGRTVAVSSSSGIHIVNIETDKVVKEIKIAAAVYGITYKNGSLWCCVNEKEIQRIQIQDDSITTVVKKQGELYGCSYITLYRDNIYQTDSVNNTVTCYNMKGEKLWVFKDTSVLSGPVGVTVDNSGNVYIASYDNHSIVVLSPGGKKNRQLLCQKDGLVGPIAIDIDLTKRKLLIVNQSGPAFLYKMC